MIRLPAGDDRETVDRAMGLGADDDMDKSFRMSSPEEAIIRKVQVLLYAE